jgi:hypothetical protein
MAPSPGPAASSADDELLGELRQAVSAADPAPADLASFANSLLAWRDPEAALAVLVADSRQLAGAVRGDTEVILRYEGNGIEISVQFSPAGRGLHRLVGQVEPATAGRVEVRRPAGPSQVTADEYGRFVVDGLRPGPISLRWAPYDSAVPSVTTAWHLL